MFQLKMRRDACNALALESFSAGLLQELRAEGKFPLSDRKWEALQSEVPVHELTYESLDKADTIIVRVSYGLGIPCFGYDVFSLDQPQFPIGFVEIASCRKDLVDFVKGRVLDVR